ncbi:MAG: SurA N-terminal domain-containing protein [Woeseia sp.]
MLQNIRDRFTGGFAIAILALLCVPFVFFGINYNFIGAGYAAKVNGEEISMFEFDDAYRRQLASYGEFGGQLPEQLRSILKQNVLNNLVWDEVVDQYLSDSGFRISDDMITKFIQSAPEFRVDGQFSKDNYYAWLAERGLEPVQFEASQRIGLRQGQLQRGVAATAFVTPAEYRRYLNLVREQREVAIATFDVDSIAESIEINDGDVQAYYDERPGDFMSSETVDLKYIELRRDQLQQQLDISEQDLRDEYAAASNRYLQDEQRQASHILILSGDDEAAAQEQATAIAARVRAGEPFADLARQYSADSGTAERGGDLGLLPHSQYQGELADTVFAMRKGEVSEPVQSDFGFHVVRLDDIQAGGPLPFEQVRAELEQELRLRRADSMWRDASRDIADALFDADSIESLAGTVGLEVQQAEGYTRSGGAPFGNNQAAINTVFDDGVLNERQISDIVELDANRSVVIQVSEYHEAERKQLSEVRDEVVASIRDERARAILTEKSSALQAALRDGQPFSAAAEAVDASAVATVVIRRDDPETDANIRDAVFAAKKPPAGQQRIGTVQTTSGDEAVFSVMRYAPGRPEAMPVAQRDEGKRALSGQAGQADYTAVVFELERNADVERNLEALAQQSTF